MREIITSLDIGSSKVKLVVSEVLNGNINILCALEEVSRGVKKGAIYNPDEIEFVIRKILKKGEEVLGIKLSKLIVNVSEDSCDFKIGESQIDITEEGEVTASSIQKVLQQTIAGNIEQGNELVAIVPIVYKVDDTKTKNPKGMKGSSLQVKSVIVSVPKREIYTVAKILEKCGCEIVDVMISSMGSYHAHKSEFTDKNTGVVLDVGAETIKIAIVNKGIIINNLVLPIGGNLVDQDLAFIYKVDIDKAKEIKEKFALANKRNASMKENMDIVNNLGEKVTVNQYEATEVVMSRLHEILNKAKNEINYLTKKEISYIIITGGLSESKGFSLEVESVFGPLAKVGKIHIVGVRDNKYAVSVGMIKYFDEKLKLRDKVVSMVSSDDLELLSGNQKNKNNINVISKIFDMLKGN